MHRVEYRIERVPVKQDEERLLQLVERLAELGRQGWHVASTDLTPHAAYADGPVTVLLERELGGRRIVAKRIGRRHPALGAAAPVLPGA